MHPLKENLYVRQRPDEGHRRWFVNEYFDIILWYDSEGGSMQGFQVCYAKKTLEKAFTWTRHYTSSHFVAEGKSEEGHLNLATSILKGHAGPIPDEVMEHLRNESGDLGEETAKMLIEKITEYNQRCE